MARFSILALLAAGIVSLAQSVTTGTEPSTDTVTSATEPSTDKVTSATEPSTEKVTNGTEPSSDKVTSVTEPSTDTVTSATEPSTDKVIITSVTEPSTNKVTSATEPPTDKVTSVTEPSTDKITSATEPSSDKVTSVTEPSTDKVTSATEPSTNKVTSATEPSTDKVTSSTEPPIDVVTNGTEVVFALMTHHHCEIEREQGRIESMGTIIDLTDSGKRMAFQLGEFIRHRYGHLLSPRYRPSEIYIRSTKAMVSAMTVLTAMAAVYPANHTWSDKINWNPVPYTTVPPKYDFNLAPLNCPLVRMALESFMGVPDGWKNTYQDALYEQDWPLSLDLAFKRLPYLEYKMISDIWDLIPSYKQGDYFGEDLYVKYISGVMLNEFFTHAKLIMAGEDTPGVRVYSGHAINVYSLVVATKASPRPIKYYHRDHCSLFSLELRRDKTTGKYFVLPVFLEQPGVEKMYLEVEGCGQLCPWDDFHNTTSANAMSEAAWQTACHINDYKPWCCSVQYDKLFFAADQKFHSDVCQYVGCRK